MSKYKMTLCYVDVDDANYVDPDPEINSLDDEGLDRELLFMDRTEEQTASIKQELEKNGVYNANTDIDQEYNLNIERVAS